MFTLNWSDTARENYDDLKAAAQASLVARKRKKRGKSTPAEGLFKQVHKTIELLAANPKHPGLQTHVYRAFANPVDPQDKVFEAYAQNNTPGAYRVFWCYGPGQKVITIIAITSHP